MLTKYKNIIWDWNGTLLDDVSLCIEIINELLVANSLSEISYEKYREIFQFPISKYYEQLGFDLSNNQFELLASDYVKQYNARVEECPLHTGVEETLDRLNILGKKQFSLSANEHLSLQEAVEQKRIDVYFDKIQGLEGVKAESKLANGFDLMKNFDIVSIPKKNKDFMNIDERR